MQRYGESLKQAAGLRIVACEFGIHDGPLARCVQKVQSSLQDYDP